MKSQIHQGKDMLSRQHFWRIREMAGTVLAHRTKWKCALASMLHGHGDER